MPLKLPRIDPKHLEIIVLATPEKSLTQDEALRLAAKKGLRLLTNMEVDELLNGEGEEWKKYDEAFPCFTSTRVTYNGVKAVVTENGKSEQMTLPMEYGWYIPDKYGIPRLAASDYKNPKARHLFRAEGEDCLVVRHRYCFGSERRDVFLFRPSLWVGVLATPILENGKIMKKR
ncbi:hypothetical protein HY570_01705 [Candidatus Micrarchaeota archaeon]|nr:hypothetical protein [Candidatus Micrarchaeota archaeon]